MSAYIYLVTNTINGKQYVGFTIDVAARMNRHKSCSDDNHFPRAIRKYGWENFDVDVIFEHDDVKWTKNVMEPYFIAWYDTLDNGYNMTSGGDGCVDYKHTDEHREYMSKKHSGSGNPFYGRPLSEEHKAKVGRADLEHWHARPIIATSPDGDEVKFDCIKFAVQSLRDATGKKFHHSAISMVAQGKRKHHHGWTFHYRY